MNEVSKRRWFSPRFLRFRLRTLLGVVAVIAITLGSLRHYFYMNLISTVHAQLSAGYGVAALRAHDNVAWINFDIDGFPSEKNRKLEVQFVALQRYHQELSEKYSRALWRPWQALEPDPDPPPDAKAE